MSKTTLKHTSEGGNKQATLFPLAVSDLLTVKKGGKEICCIQKEGFLRLCQSLQINKEKQMVFRIKNGEQIFVTVSKLKKIFGDRWFYVFAPPEKIIKDFETVDDNIQTYGTIRGEDNHAIQMLMKYVAKNIIKGEDSNVLEKKGDIERDAIKMRHFLGFDISEYRKIFKEDDRKAFKYLTAKLNLKNIYIFNPYNKPNLIPIPIGESRFDGITVETEGKNIAICISPKKIPVRRTTTCLALLYSVMPTTHGVRTRNNILISVAPEHYKFVGYFLMDNDEIQALRNNIKSWSDLSKAANKIGISKTYLLNFLFYEYDKKRFDNIDITRPNNYDYSECIPKKEQKGPGWTYKQWFERFYPPTLLAMWKKMISADSSYRNIMAYTVIPNGTKKERQEKINDLIK